MSELDSFLITDSPEIDQYYNYVIPNNIIIIAGKKRIIKIIPTIVSAILLVILCLLYFAPYIF